MKKYTKRPVTIEAVIWNGQNLREVIDFTDGDQTANIKTAPDRWEDYCALVAREGLLIHTLEGKMRAEVGDFVIRGVKGEFYPCKPDIFKLTYTNEDGSEI